MPKINLILNLRLRLLLFGCLAVLGFAISALIGYVLTTKFSAESTMAIRLATLFQDIFMLIFPAMLLALMITRRPADFMCLRRAPSLPATIVTLLVLAVATPAMNCIIGWNESLALPESIETAVRAMEENAEHSIQVLQGGTSWVDLVLSIMIVGLAAGFSEELFFRGAFLRLLTTGGVRHHAAVWIVAIMFSVLHFQFYGFVPRMLLGAYFGYLLVWSRSLWLPMIAHAFNNTAFVLASWIARRQGQDESSLDSIGQGTDWPIAIISLALTVVAMMWLYRLTHPKELNQIASDGK